MAINKIIIKDHTSEHEKRILDDYWRNDNGQFDVKVKTLLEKYNISRKQLNAIVNEYSHCEVVGSDCVDCRKPIITVITVRYAYNNYKWFERCKCCENVWLENLRATTVNLNDVYPKKFENHAEEYLPSEKTVRKSLTLSLIKTVRKGELHIPCYSGLFSFATQIVLDCETIYEFRGFTNDDNSITLEIAPFKE